MSPSQDCDNMWPGSVIVPFSAGPGHFHSQKVSQNVWGVDSLAAVDDTNRLGNWSLQLTAMRLIVLCFCLEHSCGRLSAVMLLFLHFLYYNP